MKRGKRRWGYSNIPHQLVTVILLSGVVWLMLWWAMPYAAEKAPDTPAYFTIGAEKSTLARPNASSNHPGHPFAPSLSAVALNAAASADARCHPPGPCTAAGGRLGSGAPLLVAFATRSQQIEGALVVINSAVAHAADVARLHFRVITFAGDAEDLLAGLRARLPRRVNLACIEFDSWVPRVSQLLGGKSSSRHELFDVLNFAAFYLHEIFPRAGRVLYLDTDIVVLTDLARELSERDLEGQPAAVAKDCSQHLKKYVDLDRIKKKGVAKTLPIELLAAKKSCVVNRGVVLVNIARWRSENITGAIEALVQVHISQKGPLWRAGVSQPPFLLAISGRFHDLGAEYNVRGLGRGDIAPEEVDHYKKKHMWNPYYDKFLSKCEFHCCPGCKGWSLTPFISPDTHHAKILHFNGRLKPSKQPRHAATVVLPPAPDLSKAERAAREQIPLCSCGGECLQDCAGLWWKFLPAN